MVAVKPVQPVMTYVLTGLVAVSELVQPVVVPDIALAVSGLTRPAKAIAPLVALNPLSPAGLPYVVETFSVNVIGFWVTVTLLGVVNVML